MFKIARKLASSGAIDTIGEFYKLPLIITFIFDFLSLGSNKKLVNQNKKSGEKLCDALQGMGTTFIKFGKTSG